MQSELEGFATSLSSNAADSEQNELDVYSVPAMQESTATGHDRERRASRPVYPTATRYPRDAHVVSGMLSMERKLRSRTRFRFGPMSFSATVDVIAPVFGQRSEIIVCIISYTFNYE